jgi:hypothetical protein
MDADTLRNGATVAGVSIAFLGLAYALYRDLIFSARRRPRLDLKFDGTGADQVVVPTLGGGEAAYVRLRVTNKKGKDTADEVQVQVTERRSRDDSSDATPVGLPLAWSGTLPTATDAPVHPGFERYIDLLHVDWPRPVDELAVADKHTLDVPALLAVHPQPAGDQHMLSPGKYEILLEVVARNADAARYTVAVEWDGKWPGSKEKMWQALRVQLPQKVTSPPNYFRSSACRIFFVSLAISSIGVLTKT